jgi:hypothetical protein
MTTLQAIAIIVGVVSGVSGLVLGILNYLHQRDTSRPRITVRLYHASDVLRSETPQQKENVVFVEVCNVGHVPVMMNRNIGFLPKRGQKRLLMFAAEPFSDVTWPGELKPQHAAMLSFDFGPGGLPEGSKLGRACAMSDIGDVFKASRREMRRFAKSRRAASS